MNANSIGDLRLGAGLGSPANQNPIDAMDQQMEQIRELLFGEMQRQSDVRFARIEARMDAIEARIGAMAGEIDADRRTSFDALARGVSDLGEQIKRMTARV